MTDRERVISKFLSKHLRHDPAGIGLTLGEGGWASVTALLEGCQRAGVCLDEAGLAEIVETSDKQRFAFDETGERIRANQGHSVDVDLQLEPTVPPDLLFHGTGAQIVDTILSQGLRKMRRHHVHLSSDQATAIKVGSRRGRPVACRIDSAAMNRAGHLFNVSANGVWLTDRVPPPFIQVDEGPSS